MREHDAPPTAKQIKKRWKSAWRWHQRNRQRDAAQRTAERPADAGVAMTPEDVEGGLRRFLLVEKSQR